MKQTNPDCIFCKIIQGVIPCMTVYEDKDTLAFFDIKPIAQGHMLVIPKKHARNLFDIDELGLAAMMRTTKKVAFAAKQALPAEGITLGMNNEPAAGQDVFHAHIHIIPRWKHDGLIPWPGKPFDQNEAKLLLNKIVKFL